MAYHTTPLDQRQCVHCGRTFQPLHPSRKYCSDHCSNQVKRNKAKIRDRQLFAPVEDSASRYSDRLSSPSVAQELSTFNALLDGKLTKPVLVVDPKPGFEFRTIRGIRYFSISTTESVIALEYELERIAKTDHSKTIRQHLEEITWL